MAVKQPTLFPLPDGHDRLGDKLDDFTVKDGEIFWHGAKIRTDLHLSEKQESIAKLVAFATILAAFASIVDSSVSIFRGPSTPQSDKIMSQNQPPQIANQPLRIAVLSAHFESGRARPTTQSEPNLTNAFQVLADNPQATATIHAYTDGTGSADLNRRLAQARAENVRQFFTSRSIDPARIAVEPPAADNPRADNATPAGRAQNRRVEIEIVTVPQPVSAPSS